MINKRKFAALCLLLLLAVSLHAFERATYYSNANGKSAAALKTALYKIMGNPSVKSYSSLWDWYYDTDRLSDNQVIDRYSYTKRYFTERGNQPSGMNKEHGIAQSWWGGGTTGIGADLHHVLPSESEANSRKSNYGMGVVTNQTWTNDCIKVGKGTAGNNGTIQLWEPADEWKGDFARMYFYIVTAYEEKSLVQKEGANTMMNNTYPKLQQWAYELYIKWSHDDPIDEQEITRNEIVYGIQGNRNPFIDFPGLERYIWGDFKEKTLNVDEYVVPDGNIDPGVDPGINPGVDPGVNPGVDPLPCDGTTYEKVTSNLSAWDGTYLIVYEGNSAALDGGLTTYDVANNFISVSISQQTIQVTSETEAAEFVFASMTNGHYSILGKSGKYLGHEGSKNSISSSDSPIPNVLNITNDEAGISLNGYSLRFNNQSGQNRFRYYSSGQQPVALYRRTANENPDGIEGPKGKDKGQREIYDLTGRRLSVGSVLTKGVYIIDGKKQYIK